MKKSEGKAQTAQELAQPQEVSRADMTESFVDLVGECFAYKLGKKSLAKKMKESVKADSKKASEIGKTISENLELLVKGEKVEEARQTVVAKRVELKAKREAISKATKPLREEIKPLSEAIKFCETIAIPDSLKELGKPVEPLTKLTKEMSEQIEANKAKKD